MSESSEIHQRIALADEVERLTKEGAWMRPTRRLPPAYVTVPALIGSRDGPGMFDGKPCKLCYVFMDSDNGERFVDVDNRQTVQGSLLAWMWIDLPGLGESGRDR